MTRRLNQGSYVFAQKVHRCGVLSAEERAGGLKDRDIEDAAIRLREMMDEVRH